MADMGKVIKVLECCKPEKICSNLPCPYDYGCDDEMFVYSSAIKDAIELLQQFRWIPIDEMLPEEKERVLVITESKYCYIGFYSELSGWHFPHVIHPTHWMPLPEPPEGGKQDG